MSLLDHVEKLPQFKAVVDAGSFSGAARALRLSQPNLSKVVRALEDAVGVALLTRSAKGVRLTDAGEPVYAFAEATIAACHAVQEQALHPSAAPAGEVTI